MDMTNWTRRGTKFYKSCKDVEKNKKVISKVLDANNRQLQEFQDLEMNPVSFGYKEPVTTECSKRVVNNYSLSPDSKPFTPTPNRKSLYPTADIEEPHYATPIFRYTSVDDSTRLIPETITEEDETHQRYNLRDRKDPPVVFNDTQNPTITIVTAPGFVDRMIAGTDCKPRVSQAEKSAIATALTQTSMRNTPEPVRRNIYHPQAPPAEVNCLANAMRENNLSSLHMNSAGLN